MFAVVNRFNRSWEEAATDLGASAWQRLRYVTLPILLPGILGVAMGAFTLSYDEYARTTLTIGPQQHAAAGDLRADLVRHVADAVRDRHVDHVGVVPDHQHDARSGVSHATPPLAGGYEG